MPAGIRTSLTRVYTYPAYLTYSSYAALPAAVREEADQMQSLWNAMVDVYEVAHRQQERLHKQFLQTSRTTTRAAGGTRSIGDPLECIKQLRGQNDSLEDATLLALSRTYRTAAAEYEASQHHNIDRCLPYPESMKQELSQITKRLHDTLHQLARTSPLSRSHSNAVLERMKTAIRRVPLGNLPPSKETGPPTSLFFTHNFGSQGIRLQSLTRADMTQSGSSFAANRLLTLNPASQLAEDTDPRDRGQRDFCRTEGELFVRNVPIPFEIILTPLLPKDALLKQVSLIGSQQRPQTSVNLDSSNARLRNDTTWQWHLQFTLIVPPTQQSEPKKYGMIALDFDHRLINDATPLVRVGEWVSDTGKHESVFFPARIIKNLIAAYEAREALNVQHLALKQLFVHFPFGEALADIVKEPIHSDVPLSRKRLRCIAHQAVEKAYSGPLTSIIRELLLQIRDTRIDVVRRRRQWRRDRTEFYDKLAHRLSREAGTIVLTPILMPGHSGSEGSSTCTTRSAPLAQALAHPINMQEFIHRLRHAAPIYRTTLHFVQSMHALIA